MKDKHPPLEASLEGGGPLEEGVFFATKGLRNDPSPNGPFSGASLIVRLPLSP